MEQLLVIIYNNKDTELSFIETIEIKPPISVITLVGTTSSGKSSTGNALLGYEAFDIGVEHGTTTKVSQKDYIRSYALKDTPGLMDENSFNKVVLTMAFKIVS